MAKKEFKAGLYAVIVGVIMAVVLASLTVFAYTTRYTAFSPEKVAAQYVDTIVQTGDGYNAYKNTLLSENQKIKYGDFIRRTQMVSFRNDGDDVKQADFVGTGTAEEQKAIDTVYNTMYDYYVELVNTVGWDDYETFFMSYFAKLKEVRHEVYGDDYLDYDYMFGALEANVDTYGESLRGNEQVLAADNKTVLKEAKDGKYQEMFGKDYKLTVSVKSFDELSEEEAKAYIAGFKERITPVAQSGEAKAAQFGLEDITKEKKVLFFTKEETDSRKSDMVGTYERLDCSDEMTSAGKAEVEVWSDDGGVIATQEVYLVKIGRSWYVDNTNIDTSGLYLGK